MGGRARLVNPWTITGLVVVGAIVGGVLIYRAGSGIARADREAIVAWEAAAGPKIVEAHDTAVELEALAADAPAGKATLRRARASLEDVQAALLDIQIPTVLNDTAAEFFTALGHWMRALAAVESASLDRRELSDDERERFDTAMSDAQRFYASGEESLVRIRCRARLPDCAREEAALS